MSDAAHYFSAIRKRLEQLYDGSADNPRLREQISDEVDWIDSQIERVSSAPIYVKTLEDLVQCLIDNDPEDLAADGGIRVIDVWRERAARTLSLSPPQSRTPEK